MQFTGLGMREAKLASSSFAQFAPVIRPGGHLVTSDIHYLSLHLGGVEEVPDGQGQWGRLPA